MKSVLAPCQYIGHARSAPGVCNRPARPGSSYCDVHHPRIWARGARTDARRQLARELIDAA